MSNDLSPLWIRDALKEERTKYRRVQEAYASLQNKSNSYAQGIKRLLDARGKVVAIWEQAKARTSPRYKQ